MSHVMCIYRHIDIYIFTMRYAFSCTFVKIKEDVGVFNRAKFDTWLHRSGLQWDPASKNIGFFRAQCVLEKLTSPSLAGALRDVYVQSPIYSFVCLCGI